MEGGKDRIDDLVRGHRIGIKGRGTLFGNPRAGRRITQRYAGSVDAVRIGGLHDPQHPSAGRIHPVGPVVIADRIAPPVDLAKHDMDEVDPLTSRMNIPHIGKLKIVFLNLSPLTNLFP